MSAQEFAALAGALSISLGVCCLLAAAVSRRQARISKAFGLGWTQGSRSTLRHIGLPRVIAYQWAIHVLLGGCGLALGGAVGGIGSAGFGLGLGVGAAKLVSVTQRARHRAKLRVDFAAFLRDVHLAAAAGELPGRAVTDSIARTSGTLRVCLDRVITGYQSGVPLDEAFERLEAVQWCTEYWGLMQSLWLHSQTGASLADLLADVVERSDQSRLQQGELAAKAADARWSARVLAITPLVLVAYLFVWDRWALTPLFEDPLGRAGLAVGVLLWASGVVLVSRLQVPPASLGD